MTRPLLLACTAYVLTVMWLAAPAPAAAATTDEVLAKLAQNEGIAKTFEADMKTIMKMGEKTNEMTGHIATQVVMKDGKRAGALMNVKQQMTIEGLGAMNMLTVNDGEFIWSERSSPQMGVMVTKTRSDPGKQQMGDTQQLRDQYDLKLVGEEDFDGQKMWVLEGTPKKKAEAAPPVAGGVVGSAATETGKIQVYIGQKDLACHRTRLYDMAGKETLDTQFTNVKVNAALDPALFKYTPPAGARVMDITKGMPDMGNIMKNLPKEAGAGGE